MTRFFCKFYRVLLLVMFIFHSSDVLSAPIDDFAKELATEIVVGFNGNENYVMDDGTFLKWLSEGNRLEKYKSIIAKQSDQLIDEEYGVIDLDWDEIKLAISFALDAEHVNHGIMVCDNNRAGQVAIDVGITVATIAVGLFTAGGGAAAIKAGSLAGKEILKNATSTAAKLGLKHMIGGAKRSVAISTFRTTLGGRLKKVVASKAVKWAIQHKIATLAGAGAILWFSGAGQSLVYSLVTSELDPAVLNCHNQNQTGMRNCYSVCGIHESKGYTDDLNEQVFVPAIKRKICIAAKNSGHQLPYAAYIIPSSEGGEYKPLMLTEAEVNRIKDLLPRVQNRGNCNWHANDIDMYFGTYVHNAETLDLTPPIFNIKTAIRLDE